MAQSFKSLLLLSATSSFPLLASAYSLKDDYMTNNYADFFDKFNFWTADDPTNGYVDYVSQNDAWSNGLIGNGGNIYLGVDTKNVASGRGRMSTRITSKAAYDINTLFVADIAYMPQTCGTWPAFWTTATTSTWPQQEANGNSNNQMSLHVSNKQGECSINPNPKMTANKDRWNDCNQEDNGGCDANDPRDNSFGPGFNSNGGGVYAMEWVKTHVKVWFFPRDNIPGGSNGPLGSSPDPTTWGTPATSFQGPNCDLDAHVKKQHIIFDTTFCGDWAEGTWKSSGCAASTGHSTCKGYVKNEPKDFSSAFWTVKGLKVFQ